MWGHREDSVSDSVSERGQVGTLWHLAALVDGDSGEVCRGAPSGWMWWPHCFSCEAFMRECIGDALIKKERKKNKILHAWNKMLFCQKFMKGKWKNMNSAFIAHHPSIPMLPGSNFIQLVPSMLCCKDHVLFHYFTLSRSKSFIDSSGFNPSCWILKYKKILIKNTLL